MAGGAHARGILVLLVLAAAPVGVPIATFPVLGRRMVLAVAAVVDAPGEATRVAGMLTSRHATQQLRRSVRGIVIASGLALVLVALLASGDALFASLLGASALGRRAVDALIVGIGALTWFTLLIGGRRSPLGQRAVIGDGSRRTFVMGGRELAFVLGAVAVVLGGYVISLVAGAVGGVAYVERRTGLTYAEYARRGFFQLVAVVAIVSALLVSCRRVVGASPRRRAVLVTALTIAGLTLVMVVVSIARLQTYRSVFGLTMLRFSTTVFAAWLGVVVVLIAAVLVRRRWEPSLVTAVVLSAYVTLVVANWVNPEALVARENVARFDSAATGAQPGRKGAFDIAYLGTQLSDDAVPPLLARLDRLPDDQRRTLTGQLCASTRVDDGWSWNRSRARADRLLAALCPP